MKSPGITNILTQQIRKQVSNELEDLLAIEEPLQIQLRQRIDGIETTKNVSITMRTPGNDSELAIGFLFTEGIISRINQIADVSCTDNTVLVELMKDTVVDVYNLERNFYTTSSCGVCGKTSLEAVKVKSIFSAEEDSMSIKVETLYNLATKLREHQILFERTGGLHASALFSSVGDVIFVREDVGRHNALDKLIGTMLRADKLPLRNTILMLSGRISFELVQKAYMAGIVFIAAVGAPSSLAVELAKECGITLVGFLRENRMNVYNGNHRISI